MKRLTITLLTLLMSMGAWAEEIFLECEGRCWAENCEENGQGSEFTPFEPGKKINIAVNTAKKTISLYKDVEYQGSKTILANYPISNMITEKDSGKYVMRTLKLNRSNGILVIEDTSWMKSKPGEDLNMAWYRYQCKKIEPLF